jgi:hypothetical protein
MPDPTELGPDTGPETNWFSTQEKFIPKIIIFITQIIILRIPRIFKTQIIIFFILIL